MYYATAIKIFDGLLVINKKNTRRKCKKNLILETHIALRHRGYRFLYYEL